MKKALILCLVLALACTGGALAEEAADQPSQEGAEPANLEGITLVDRGIIAIETETEIGDVLSVTVHRPAVEASWRSLPEDSRNQYLVVPVSVMNLNQEEVNVPDTVKVMLNYKKYGFEPEITVADDEQPDSIVGEWTVYETDSDGNKINVFQCVIRSIDPAGKVDMAWGDYIPNGAIWEEKSQELILDGNQRFRYQDGVLGGGGNGNRWRSVLFRSNPLAASGDSSVLGMLEEATFSYVFKCPNTVISHLAECVLNVEAAGQRFAIELK